MRCNSWGLSLHVIRSNAAISACEKCGQWQRVAPLLDEMRQLGLIASCDQFQRSHLSVRHGRTQPSQG
eukprot:8560698-Karenia_brevis.AAC.1